MKTEKSLSYLRQALNHMPNSNKYSEAKNLLRRAYGKIQDVDIREAKKESTVSDNDSDNVSKQWAMGNNGVMSNPFEQKMFEQKSKVLLKTIEQMIQEEKDKLDTIKQEKNTPQKPTGPVDMLNG